MEKINLFTLTSKNYSYYSNNLISNIKNCNKINLNVHEINPLNNKFRTTPFKLEFIYNIIKQDKFKNEILLFLDTTSLIDSKKIDKLLSNINTNLDLSLTKEFHGKFSNTYRINIGVLFIKCNDTMISFFKNLLNDFKNHLDIHDQYLFQIHLLNNKNIKWDYLNDNIAKIVSSKDDNNINLNSIIYKFIRRPENVDSDVVYKKIKYHLMGINND
jgi:hypothetical protein